MFPSSNRSLLPAAFLAVLCGCHANFDHFDSDRVQEPFHYSFPLSAGGRVSIDNENGSIDVATWERNEIEINGTKYANSEDLLKDVKIESDATRDGVSVRTIRRSISRGNSGARFTIRVPKHVILARIHSTNGPISIDGVEGTANVESSNGALHFTHFTGPIDGRTSNGSIEVDSCKGDLRLVSSNGKIEGDASAGAIEAKTSNGNVRLHLGALDGRPPVRVSTSNGAIELTYDQPHETRATTSNSSITVYLPDKVNADIHARTSHSKVTTDFGVGSGPSDEEDAPHGSQGKTLEQRLGSGGALIDLTTTNGSIHIAKR